MSPGFAIWLRNFREIFTDEMANGFSEYLAAPSQSVVADRDAWSLAREEA